MYIIGGGRKGCTDQCWISCVRVHQARVFARFPLPPPQWRALVCIAAVIFSLGMNGNAAFAPPAAGAGGGAEGTCA